MLQNFKIDIRIPKINLVREDLLLKLNQFTEYLSTKVLKRLNDQQTWSQGTLTEGEGSVELTSSLR